MNLKGKQTYTATAQQIWDILMDTEKLAKITPGVSKLELVGDNQYNAISEIKIGPVKGTFKGDLFLEDKQEPSGFTLRVKQLSKIGNADATVNIHINELESGTCELAFDGKAKLSGTLARTGQRVLTGVANSLTKQFFKGLAEEIAATTVAESVAKTVIEAVPVASAAKAAPDKPTEVPIASSSPSISETKPKVPDESPGFLAWLKSLFGL